MKNYKIKFATLYLAIFLISCEKKEIHNDAVDTQNTLEQKPVILSDSTGNKISVTYFAKDDEVAVKLIKDEELMELTAKGTNQNGEPIFSNEKVAWQITEDGQVILVDYLAKMVTLLFINS